MTPSPAACDVEHSILLVVANDNFRATLRRILGRCGYRVDEAVSGEQALVRLQQSGYDAVVTDVRLPGQVSGLTLMRRLREAGQGIPVFVLTEEETARIRSALESCDGATCVHLPLDINRLKQMIASRCGGGGAIEPSR